MPGYGLGARSAVNGTMLIRRAVAAGVTYLDSAAGYGESESLIGGLSRTITARGIRVCTKLSVEQLLSGRVADSLTCLRTPQIDTLLIHSARSADLSDPRPAQALAQLKNERVTRKAGASTYGSAGAVLALAQPWCDVVQVEHSLLNPSVVSQARVVKRAGQEIVVRSVLCKGLLTDRRASASLPADAVVTLDRLAQLSQEWAMPLAQLALRFALDTPAVDVVLVGVSTVAELDTALEAWTRPPLAPWQLEMLREFDRSDESWTHPEQWQAPVA